MLSIKMLNILSYVFSLNDEGYNQLLVKARFGNLLAELIKTQFCTLGQIFDKKKNDINILNVS